MIKDQETHLDRKISNFSSACVHCGNPIISKDTFYQEVGNLSHIHSLIARKYCEQCYIKFGEKMLLKGEK